MTFLWGGGDGNGCPFDSPNDPKLRWNPSYSTHKYLKYNEFYGSVFQRGVAVLEGNAPMMYDGGLTIQAKAICKGLFDDLANHDKPESYLQYAQWASLFAAKFGSPPTGGYPVGFESVKQQFVAGTDLQFGNGSVRYVELFNEPDNAWSDGLDRTVTGDDLDNNPVNTPTKYYFRPREYAALVSAAYDGNTASDTHFDIKNASGAKIGHWGIKNLSPNTKVVLAGVADMRRDYLDLLRKKWDIIRGAGNYPFDVVNYHFYPTTSHPDQNGWEKFYHGRDFFGYGQGQYPEATNIALRERVSVLLAEQHPVFAAKPTWITEFGYDSEPNSNVIVPDLPGYDRQKVQGQWITRYLFEVSAAKGDGRRVQKAFIYDLTDDKSKAGGQYGSAGLLKKNGMPKKSWYHVRTMLSVLGDRAFVSTNKPVDPTDPILIHAFLENGQILPFDNPRVYEYGGQKTLALWVPSGVGSAAAKIGSVLLKKNLNSDPKPNIQAVEVVDYDEDGKRTLIDPNLIESYTDPNNGQQYWKINKIRPGDAGFQVSETPVYLRIGQAKMASDPAVPPVVNLTANCFGCSGTIHLQWDWPPSIQFGYSFYQIYYQAWDLLPPPQFDPQTATLYTEQLDGHAKEAFIAGLPAACCYVFWVVPFQSVTNSSDQTYLTYAPSDMSAPVASRHYVAFNPANCPAYSGCFLPITANQITVVNSPFTSSWLYDRAIEAITDPSGKYCGLINGTPDNPGMILGNGDEFVFTVDFGSVQKINILSFYHQGGTGRVTIELDEECCGLYVPYMTLLFEGSEQWYHITNTLLNQRYVQRLRFTIVGLPETGTNIRRMLFCTTPKGYSCSGPGAPNGTPVVDPVQNGRVADVDSRSARIQWESSEVQFAGTRRQALAYKVRYSIARTGQNELIQPFEQTVEGTERQGLNESILSPLAPNTTYYVEVLPDREFVPCADAVAVAFTSPVRLEFKTLTDEAANGRSSPERLPQPEVRLFPNPATDYLDLELPLLSYDHFSIYHLSGTTVASGELDGAAPSQRISIKNLSPGMYMIYLIGKQVAPQAKAFLVVR